jgi:hypothetical protein
MTPEERAITAALETFRHQANECIMCLYAYVTIHTVAAKSKAIRDHINHDAIFWGTTLNALKASLIIALGRVFENNSEHNLRTFMQVIHDNRVAFRRAALRGRKAATFGDDVVALNSYVRAAQIPHPSDFARLRKFVTKHRRTYEQKYRDLRHKIFAHTLVVNQNEVAALYQQTNVRELERMTTFLGRLHECILYTYQDGGRFSTRPRRYSVKRMLKKPKGRTLSRPIQEDTVTHTRRALQPWTVT